MHRMQTRLLQFLMISIAGIMAVDLCDHKHKGARELFIIGDISHHGFITNTDLLVVNNLEQDVQTKDQTSVPRILTTFSD